MKRFLYIVAYMPYDPDSILSFAHKFVTAEDEDAAYSIGMSTLDDEIGGVLQNNYVIELPDAH